uniref:CCHC-type domain-containing protein n=1 Tax=Xenopus tropicalis TaxID=8364 RepID=A0A803JFI4_XENTR
MEVRFSHCLKNELGYWNGKRKFFVKFRRDPEGIGGYMRPPSNFLIGRNRGYLFYSGMPLYCRNCLRFGHTSENCSEARQTRCNKCGRPGHVAALCTYLKTCNMCGKEGHIYKDCPKVFGCGAGYCSHFSGSCSFGTMHTGGGIGA